MKHLRYPDLRDRGIVKNRATLSNWIRDLGFPAGQLLGPNCRTWPEEEIEAWIASRPADKKPAVRRKHAVQAGTHSHADRAAALYQTPPAALEALLDDEKLPKHIWEPASGKNAITNLLRTHGHTVTASDIHDHGEPLDFVGDFLEHTEVPAGTEMILTNPPFKIIGEFVRHALDLCPKVIVLARLAFLESLERTDILEDRGLARVHVFRRRLPMMHRQSWDGPKAGNSVAFAWFCWDRGHSGPTTIDRVG